MRIRSIVMRGARALALGLLLSCSGDRAADRQQVKSAENFVIKVAEEFCRDFEIANRALKEVDAGAGDGGR